jgi:pimeloyl-ACP methyl ester carboxylesterase
MPNDGEDIGQRDWLDDDCVLPFLVWVRQYSGLSESTCRRITQPGGGGPSLVRLSERLPLYPKVQTWFREKQPPTLIIWGKNDYIFPEPGAHPYKRDLQDLEFHLLDTGHFVLEDKADEAFPLIYDFLDRKVAGA